MEVLLDASADREAITALHLKLTKAGLILTDRRPWTQRPGHEFVGHQPTCGSSCGSCTGPILCHYPVASSGYTITPPGLPAYRACGESELAHTAETVEIWESREAPKHAARKAKASHRPSPAERARAEFERGILVEVTHEMALAKGRGEL